MQCNYITNLLFWKHNKVIKTENKKKETHLVAEPPKHTHTHTLICKYNNMHIISVFIIIIASFWGVRLLFFSLSLFISFHTTCHLIANLQGYKQFQLFYRSFISNSRSEKNSHISLENVHLFFFLLWMRLVNFSWKSNNNTVF